MTRRRFVRGAFATGVGLAFLGSLGFLLDFLYPRNLHGFGTGFSPGNVRDYPKGGDPRHFPDGQFWVAHLDPAEIRPGGSGGGSGLLALWHKCPHLGCMVPWRAEFACAGDTGWYRCPCHDATFTRAGTRVFGPAPRSMDTMAIHIDDARNITVDTGAITRAGPDNPQRAIQHPLLPA